MTHIDELRLYMAQHKIDAYIIPSSDPHNSEYLPKYWKIREWITGFTGSAGTAIITQNYAGLWTDSRYFIQAQKELFSIFTLHKETDYSKWLLENLHSDSTIGVNPELISQKSIESLQESLKNKDCKIIFTNDIFSNIWKSRPKLPYSQAFELDTKYSGINRQEKIALIRKELNKKKCEALIETSLDNIAWTLNIRGNDVDYNPVIISYLLITNLSTIWFVNKDKVSDEIINNLKHDNVKVFNYNDFHTYITNIELKIATDKSATNALIINSISEDETILDCRIITNLKAIKNAVEIANTKKAMILDGITMSKFLYQFYNNIKLNKFTEIILSEAITTLRKEHDSFISNSFTPISAYGANAALPHYCANSKTNSEIKEKGLYLLDSGGQYLEGTTDITRTLSCGNISQKEKDYFTLVLKGHIRIATLTFPEETKGYQLDSFSRYDLWQNGLDFGHGTGHGVGYFLNVHEGPHGINSKCNGTGNSIIKEGMMVTNEPGIYIENEFGIRIENILLCKKSKSHKGYLCFETLTLCPYDKSLINKDLLNNTEIEWINSYHSEVYNKIAPFTNKAVSDWLKEATSPL